MFRTLFGWLGVSALLGAGCVSGLAARMDTMSRQITQQHFELKQLRSEVTDGLTMALCTPELRTLLENVQKECTAAEGEQQMCTTKQIRPAVIAADPEHRGRFLKMMSHLPHEVLYIPNAGSAVPSFRVERLARMTRRALLGSTVFMVVSSPESGEEEAIRRAGIAEEMMRDRGVPLARIKRWIYAYPATKNDIDRIVDQPGLGETRDLNRGVWIFRADC